MNFFGSWHSAVFLFTSKLGSSSATLVENAYSLVLLRHPRGAGANACILDASMETVLLHARVKHSAAKP